MQTLDALNLWLVELSQAGILPDGWFCGITNWIDKALVLLGFGPQFWG